jgi:hypothetical protein
MVSEAKAGVLYYDRYDFKIWVLYLKDAEGNQVGDAEYYAFKREAKDRINELKSMGVKEWEIGKRS